jgi:hypothetical protein
VLAHLPLTENTSVEIALGTLRRESVRHGHCTRQVTETAQGYLGNGIVVLQTEMVVCRSENRIPTRSVGPARGLMVCTQTDAVPWSRDCLAVGMEAVKKAGIPGMPAPLRVQLIVRSNTGRGCT